jgi:hypothetical protein
MKNSDQNQDEFIPGNEDTQARGQNSNPDKDTTGNWDQTAHMSKNIEKNIRHDERRNLNPDREKRTGSNLSPDRNSGDR